MADNFGCHSRGSAVDDHKSGQGKQVMGMYDSVRVPCPDCKEVIEFQSKAGECSLADYELHNAPPAILGDLDGQTCRCSKCGRAVTIRTTVFARTE
jgi:phage FluMu protein Com